jgi:uncharacterized membrane protein YgcG
MRPQAECTTEQCGDICTGQCSMGDGNGHGSPCPCDCNRCEGTGFSFGLDIECSAVECAEICPMAPCNCGTCGGGGTPAPDVDICEGSASGADAKVRPPPYSAPTFTRVHAPSALRFLAAFSSVHPPPQPPAVCPLLTAARAVRHQASHRRARAPARRRRRREPVGVRLHQRGVRHAVRGLERQRGLPGGVHRRLCRSRRRGVHDARGRLYRDSAGHGRHVLRVPAPPGQGAAAARRVALCCTQTTDLPLPPPAVLGSSSGSGSGSGSDSSSGSGSGSGSGSSSGSGSGRGYLRRICIRCRC